MPGAQRECVLDSCSWWFSFFSLLSCSIITNMLRRNQVWVETLATIILNILTHFFQCLVLLVIFVLCFQTKRYLVKQGHTENSPATWPTNVPPVPSLSHCKEDGRLELSQWKIVSQVRRTCSSKLLFVVSVHDYWGYSLRMCSFKPWQRELQILPCSLRLLYVSIDFLRFVNFTRKYQSENM